MVGTLSNKAKQIFLVVIKMSIVVGSIFYIYQNIVENEFLKFDDFIQFLRKNDEFSPKNVIFLLFLTIFNWFLEIKKWQNLVSFSKNISFLLAFKQSLAALTASLITPNRIGDYAAKAVYYHKTMRKRILLFNLIANMAQMSATLLFGIIGVILFINKYELPISNQKIVRGLLFLVIIVLSSFYIIGQKKITIRGFSINKIKQFIFSITALIHLKNWLFSVLRYLIFSFQFYYLLIIFGVDVSYVNAMIVISSMYLLASVIPTLFLFDVVIKGSVAVFLFGIVGVNGITVLSVTTVMWILNFVLPSLIGSVYVLNFKQYSSYLSGTIKL